jgi:hypothetical protein
MTLYFDNDKTHLCTQNQITEIAELAEELCASEHGTESKAGYNYHLRAAQILWGSAVDKISKATDQYGRYLAR